MTKTFGFLQAGFSFVELSVATAIFSMGLGSFSLMMLAAIQGTAEARHQTVASSQAESLAEMIAMSSDAFGHYVFPAETLACTGEDCSGQSMAAANLAHWQQSLQDELPGGSGLVCRDSKPDDGEAEHPACDGNGPLVIKVFWEEARHSKNADGGKRRVISRLPW
ncbi:MAG: type IV pilus modification protein PilV [Desulfuromonadales bacterium]